MDQLRHLTDVEMEDIISFIDITETRNQIKDQLKKVQVKPSIISKLKQDIERKYFTSFVQPGEAVGMLAAANIGEGMMQKTLNSVDHKHRIVLDINNVTKEGKIGKIIDKYFQQYKHTSKFKRFVYTEKDKNLRSPVISGYVDKIDVSDLNMKTLGVDEYGNVKWRQIEAFVRHPLYNKLLKVRTRDGREVCATSAKSFLVRRNDKIIPINGSDLRIGDRLPITIHYENNIEMENELVVLPTLPLIIQLDEPFGFVFGAIISISGNDNGIGKQLTLTLLKQFCQKLNVSHYIQKEKKDDDHFKFLFSSLIMFTSKACGKFSHNRHVPNFAFNAPDEFIKGLLSGYFSINGCVSSESLITCTSTSERLIDGIIFLLNRFGIYSSKLKSKTKKIERNNKGSQNIFQLWVLGICDNNIKKFYETITLHVEYKQKILEQQASNTFKFSYSQDDFIPGNRYNNIEIHRDALKNKICPDVLFSEIVSIEEVNPTTEYVYDLTVKDVKNFTLLNGLNLRDTFHSSGISIKTVVAGVPRFQELIGSTKNPKSVICTIFPKNPTDLLVDVKRIGKQLSEIKFHNIIRNYSVDVKPKQWYKSFELLFPDSSHHIYHPSSTITRYRLNKKVLFENRLELSDICKKIEHYIHDNNYVSDESEWIKCIWSPINYSTIDIVSNIKISLDVFENILLYGIEGIRNVEYKRIKPSNIWCIEAEGSNIQSILALDDVDKASVMCNDMWKIYECFGIEATRQFLIEEFTSIISSDGTFVHECNIKILADIMTHTGMITSISRYSVKKSNTGVLGKASFEESFSNLVEGSELGEKDNINSVSSAIIVGKAIGAGTGICTLLQKLKF